MLVEQTYNGLNAGLGKGSFWGQFARGLMHAVATAAGGAVGEAIAIAIDKHFNAQNWKGGPPEYIPTNQENKILESFGYSLAEFINIQDEAFSESYNYDKKQQLIIVNNILLKLQQVSDFFEKQTVSAGLSDKAIVLRNTTIEGILTSYESVINNALTDARLIQLGEKKILVQLPTSFGANDFFPLKVTPNSSVNANQYRTSGSLPASAPPPIVPPKTPIAIPPKTPIAIPPKNPYNNSGVVPPKNVPVIKSSENSGTGWFIGIAAIIGLVVLLGKKKK